MNLRLIAIATSSTLLLGYAAAAFANEPYKTSSNQVIVPGLQPRQTYSVQTTYNNGREDSMFVSSNACGEAVIYNSTNYQRVTINNQTIRPFTLSTKGQPYCNPQQIPTSTTGQPSNNRPPANR
ncbi:hypothetical protein [Argonema antarcticum]|uniref:hypothetical protein n=1 Tax=Argonema antarcticum TaxID=2942763 RepID=UPI002011816D|nr:hypothetical protein [Argonema antarcticum]MCL1471083.1 hypothetical protein [Argonema antarcticum A004/B2]